MKKFKTHIVLISDQMTPNATPVMDKSIRPEKVIICATDEMNKRAHHGAR